MSAPSSSEPEPREDPDDGARAAPVEDSTEADESGTSGADPRLADAGALGSRAWVRSFALIGGAVVLIAMVTGLKGGRPPLADGLLMLVGVLCAAGVGAFAVGGWLGREGYRGAGAGSAIPRGVFGAMVGIGPILMVAGPRLGVRGGPSAYLVVALFLALIPGAVSGLAAHRAGAELRGD